MKHKYYCTCFDVYAERVLSQWYVPKSWFACISCHENICYDVLIVVCYISSWLLDGCENDSKDDIPSTLHALQNTSYKFTSMKERVASFYSQHYEPFLSVGNRYIFISSRDTLSVWKWVNIIIPVLHMVSLPDIFVPYNHCIIEFLKIFG